MDARDYPDAYLIEDELVEYGTRNHFIDKAAKEIKQLRAKVAELEAKLEKYQNLEPACWMTPDGEGWRMRTKPPENDVPLGWMPLYALEMK